MKTTMMKTIVGVMLMPLVFSLFLMDRIILAFFFWKDAPAMKTWMVKDQLMMAGFWRVTFVLITYGMIKLFEWIL